MGAGSARRMKQEPYNLTRDIEKLTRIIARNVEEFTHLDPDRMVFGISAARSRSQYGVFARTYPLRFEGGAKTTRHRGHLYEWPEWRVRGHSILYYIDFMIPRYLDLPPEQKVRTLVHELFHISPFFNGDLRVLGKGRHKYHGRSRKWYEQIITPMVNATLRLDEIKHFPFVHLDFSALSARHGAITGQRAKRLRPRAVQR